jgi:hypothetical protein
MKKSLSMFSATLFLLYGVGITSLQAAEAEWVTLVEGGDGMQNFNSLGEGNWAAVDGAIQATGSAGGSAAFLVSQQSFGDFALLVEFWASEDANSGLYLRCQDPTTITDRNCYEANIFDQRPDATYGTGGIVHIGAITEPMQKAGGKWNTYEITLNGPRLLVVLNGQTTVDVTDSQFASGPIALQWGRGTIRFRKVQVREL